MKTALAITALLFALLVIPALFRQAPKVPAQENADVLPWKVEALGDGNSRVFGLTVGKDTLLSLEQRFGKDHELALIAAPGEAGSVEIYFERLPEGFPGGRLIATADLDSDTVAAMKARAGKFSYMDSNTRKYPLAAEDRQTALNTRFRALAFIPAINLEEQTILDRFGPPAERIKGEGTTEHFLYPVKGLDVVFDSKGKELLQYVPPARFSALREPLAKRQADAGK